LVIDISIGRVEAAAPPVAGSKAMEMAIKAAKIVRAKTMYGTIWRYGLRVNGVHEALM
jgi:hypothetical protein